MKVLRRIKIDWKLAIREVLFIFIGINLAILFNSWYQKKLDIRQEQSILNKLKIEYLSNKEQLEEKINLRKSVIQSIDEILTGIDNDKVNLSSTDFDSLLLMTLMVPTFDPRGGVTTEIIQSGKLYIISNDSLRTLLTQWSALVKELKEEELQQKKIVAEHYVPLLVKNCSMRNITSQLSNNYSAYYQLGSWSLSNHNNLNVMSNNLKILENQEFENWISLISLFSKYSNEQSKKLKAHIDKTLQYINSDLEL